MLVDGVGVRGEAVEDAAERRRLEEPAAERRVQRRVRVGVSMKGHDP